MLLARKASPAIGMLCEAAEVQAQKLTQLAGAAWQEFQPFMLVDGYIDLSIFNQVTELVKQATRKGRDFLKKAYLNDINETCIAILKDGFYEVNGFKLANIIMNIFGIRGGKRHCK